MFARKSGVIQILTIWLSIISANIVWSVACRFKISHSFATSCFDIDFNGNMYGGARSDLIWREMSCRFIERIVLVYRKSFWSIL